MFESLSSFDELLGGKEAVVYYVQLAVTILVTLYVFLKVLKPLLLPEADRDNYREGLEDELDRKANLVEEEERLKRDG